MLNKGQKISRLTILNFDHYNKKRDAYYLCRCDCGNEKIIRGSKIGKITHSCGCLRLEIVRRKKPELSNEKSHLWKENVGYRAIHLWVIKNKGKANKCSHCGANTGKIEWANIDHKYRRNLDDYIQLCTSCHRDYDIKNNNYRGRW